MAIENRGQVYVSDKRIYATADGKIVGEDDPRKQTLVAAEGAAISLTEARRYKLVPEDAGTDQERADLVARGADTRTDEERAAERDRAGTAAGVDGADATSKPDRKGVVSRPNKARTPRANKAK